MPRGGGEHGSGSLIGIGIDHDWWILGFIHRFFDRGLGRLLVLSVFFGVLSRFPGIGRFITGLLTGLCGFVAELGVVLDLVALEGPGCTFAFLVDLFEGLDFDHGLHHPFALAGHVDRFLGIEVEREDELLTFFNLELADDLDTALVTARHGQVMGLVPDLDVMTLVLKDEPDLVIPAQRQFATAQGRGHVVPELQQVVLFGFVDENDPAGVVGVLLGFTLGLAQFFTLSDFILFLVFSIVIGVGVLLYFTLTDITATIGLAVLAALTGAGPNILCLLFFGFISGTVLGLFFIGRLVFALGRIADVMDLMEGFGVAPSGCPGARK